MTNFKPKYSIFDESTSLDSLDYYDFSYQGDDQESEFLWEMERGSVESGYED